MRFPRLFSLVVAVTLSGGCRGPETGDSGSTARTQGGSAMPLTVTSDSFRPQGEIPAVYTCQGDDLAPALKWTGVPAETQSLAVIVDDPDAPGGTWTHWVLYDVPPTTAGLPEGVTQATLPAGTRQGRNDWNRTGYGGPCPPRGRHRYFHRVFALDIVLPDLHEPTRQDLEQAMNGHILAHAELVGTYQKH